MTQFMTTNKHLRKSSQLVSPNTQPNVILFYMGRTAGNVTRAAFWGLDCAAWREGSWREHGMGQLQDNLLIPRDNESRVLATVTY